MIITYDKSINDTHLSIIKARIEKFSYLLPDWCQNLIVFYTTENPEGFTLSCSPDYHYRFANITVYPGFFDDLQWETSIVHELIHIIESPYTDKVETILRYFIPEERLCSYLLKELSNEEEAVTQDFAKMVMSLDTNHQLVV